MHSSIGGRDDRTLADSARSGVQLGTVAARLAVDLSLLLTDRGTMTIRTVSTRARRAAALAAVLSLLIGAVPAHAATAVDIEVRALAGGRYEIGGWLALSVTLVNQGAPVEGYLTAETDGGTVRRFVEMPAGARKVVPLYVEPEAFQREVTVTYTEPNGSATTTAEVRVLEQTSGQIAIVGDAGGTIRPQILGSGQGSRPEPLSIGIADIPERPEPLSGLSAIVWAADSTGLTSGQLGSLERWASAGGQLVVLGGADWQARTAGFTDLLPVTTLASADGTSLATLAAWVGQDGASLEPATVSTGPLRDDARAIITADDGSTIASMRPFGAGQVVLIGADLAVQDFQTWPGAASMWDRIVPSSAIFDQFFGGGMPDEMRSAMNGALSTLPTLRVPPAEFLLAVIVGYILLIGPISYLVLRRVDRRELAWVTAPLLIVTFSACSYGIGRSLKGSDVIVNQVAVVRTSPTGAALAETFAGVFSPDRSTYHLTVDADALMGALDTSSFDGIPRSTGNVLIEQGRPAHLRDLTIGAFGFQGVQASGLVEVEPALEVTWSTRDGERFGTVTNTSSVEIVDVAYISTAGGERIGTLAPGASAEFTPPIGNFNGSSASDQVYGFGGFDTASEEQRLVSLRRQVIDALVGYGGWAGIEMGSSFGRGPYVIGWRADEGPMPVSVDGLTARRHTASVEVVNVRPTIGVGEVTIQPHLMSVTMTDTEGDVAGGFEAGSVIINDGSATFSIGLPLEASGLEPTAVEIVVGPDPSVMLGNVGDFGGFWPDGFTLEVRNAATGLWTLLGELNDGSSFTVDDPTSVLGSTGLIEVRVAGRTDPNFGQSGVFVSAEVRGVIDR